MSFPDLVDSDLSQSLIDVDSGLRLLLVKVDFRRYLCFWLSSQVLSRSGVDYFQGFPKVQWPAFLFTIIDNYPY